MQIIPLPAYEKKVRKLLTEEERVAMEAVIASAPALHPVIPGSGGIRKIRWKRAGQGKSGGVRTLHIIVVRIGAIALLDIYAKNEKENIDEAEKKVLKSIAATSRKEHN